jgi:hypothetical protein
MTGRSDLGREPRRTPWWQVVAWVSAMVLFVVGFAVLGIAVLLTSSAGRFGSNK